METPKNLTLCYSNSDVRRSLSFMAHKIKNYYELSNLVFIIVLKGGVFTGMQLLDLFEEDIPYGFIGLNSYYGEEIKPSKHVHCTYKPIFEGDFLLGKDILIVDDIVESGATIAFARKMLKTFSPKSVGVCALVDKSTSLEHEPYFSGFQYKGGEFIVGCGMGLGEKYRNLNDIYTYKI